jgi:5-methylcytosine-specific restriction endonuclease McrA
MARDKDNDRATKRAWRLAHPEQVRAYKKAYYAKYRARELAKAKAKYAASLEARRALMRARYGVNQAQRNEQQRQRYAADPERIRALNRKYRAARIDEFRERDREYGKAYQSRHPERFHAIHQRASLTRRALKADAFIEAIDALTVFDRDEGVCGICHHRVDPASKWHIDHVVPLSKGGVHSYANVQLAHARCNLSKQAKLPDRPMIILGSAR